MNEENFPMSRLDVVLSFNEIRTETMEMFSEVLKMAYTKQDRENIVIKMEQLELQI